jgi:hypothetical protein
MYAMQYHATMYDLARVRQEELQAEAASARLVAQVETNTWSVEQVRALLRRLSRSQPKPINGMPSPFSAN